MPKFLTLLLVLLGLMLVSCAPDQPAQSSTPQASDPPDTGVHVPNDTYSEVYDVVTKNGVECVVFAGEQVGGISCNWAKYNKVGE